MVDSNGNRIPVLAMLTTTDNPFDPFDEFDDWLAFDHKNGYNSCEEAALRDVSSNDWPERDKLLAYEDAVDFCVKLNRTGNRMKVTRET